MSALVVKGGLVVDGTGDPARVADVAIDGDRVVEVGTGLSGDQEIDGGGLVVAPGFIDIHTHYDAQVFWDPALTPSCFHGVTTVVAGNCGFSIAPVRPEHHELVARTLENVEDMNLSPDAKSAIQGIEDGVGRLHTESILYVLQIRDVLTPEQRKNYDEHIIMALMRSP